MQAVRQSRSLQLAGQRSVLNTSETVNSLKATDKNNSYEEVEEPRMPLFDESNAQNFLLNGGLAFQAD